MKKIFSALFIVFSINYYSTAQPQIQWQHSYGVDHLECIRKTSDGATIMCGWNWDDGLGIAVKLNSLGGMLWQKIIGQSERLYSCQQTSDGGYIFSGTSSTGDSGLIEHGGWDYYLAKCDSAGNLIWQKSYGGSSGEWNSGVRECLDKGFIISGTSGSLDGDVTGQHGGGPWSDYWIVKVDSAGALEWEKCFGGSDEDWGHSVDITNDGGFIVAGQIRSTDGDVIGGTGYDGWVFKLDSAGNIQWQRILDDWGLGDAWSVQTINNNEYIVGGGIIGFAKLDSAGHIVWITGGFDGDIRSVYQTSDGGFVGGGDYIHFDNQLEMHDFFVVKVDGNGNTMWKKFIDVDFGYGKSIVQTNDLGYIIVGEADGSNVVKLGAFNAYVSSYSQTICEGEFYSFNGMQLTVEGYYVDSLIAVTGTDSIVHLHLIVVECTGLASEINSKEISISPNPTTTEIKITNLSPTENQIRLFNLLGQQVKSIRVSNVQTTTIPVSDLPAGIYVVTIFDGEKIVCKKLVKD